jgi:hypothetical protein
VFKLKHSAVVVQLYFRAIKMNQRPSKMSHVETFPSFWHKNFALACERLLHVDETGGLDKVIVSFSLRHFFNGICCL